MVLTIGSDGELYSMDFTIQQEKSKVSLRIWGKDLQSTVINVF